MITNESKRIHRGLADVYFDKTRITDIQGESGRLVHRGHSIEDLAARPDFETVAYLLINEHLPASDESQRFRAALAERRKLPSEVVDLIQATTRVSPDIALRTIVSVLGDTITEDWEVIAMMPSIVVAHHALRHGRPMPDPMPNEDLASDFLARLMGRPLTELERRVINLDFVLHADHGANASTFVARIATGTETDFCGALAAAIATFAGTRHGGAVAGVARMLDDLGTPEAAKAFTESYRPGGEPVMGFGHRVYRVEDPRAKLFRKAADELSAAYDDRRMLDTLEALVEGMKKFQRFGISPNVDLYAAVIYRLLGLPDDLSTAIFATARSAGWVAQIREQKANNILIRPAPTV